MVVPVVVLGNGVGNRERGPVFYLPGRGGREREEREGVGISRLSVLVVVVVCMPAYVRASAFYVSACAIVRMRELCACLYRARCSLCSSVCLNGVATYGCAGKYTPVAYQQT